MSEPIQRRLGRPPRAANQRERILREASILFARSGYAASSLNDLAGEAGISKAGIYHYFKSKQDVYDAIIIQTLVGLFDHVRTAVQSVEEPSEKLRAFMTAHASFFEHNYWAFCCMLVTFGGMSESISRQEAADLRERYEHLLRGIIAEGVKQGRFRPVDPADTGRAVLSMLNWMARWFHPGGQKTASEIAESYADLLFCGLCS
jgi:AcrR family transcriptional regulator